MALPLPAGFTLYDWMELRGFTWKIENEGYEYAAEEYAPEFETAELKAIAEDDDPRPLRRLVDDHEQAMDTWQEQTGWDEVDRLWTAHQREQKERGEQHLLWALHPGVDWDGGAYSTAYESREKALDGIKQQNELAEKYDHFTPFTGRLMHRREPGGDWTVVPIEHSP
ncbi:hypothetical protein [Streptomyces prunicolor]|uniref:hypothetical protein n=1 Tax=Streptomyces prunicolor TaxID=67348 RepID=UPI000369E4A4|nr:hypothetical protein [Streptomyces prunicolor]